MKKRILLVLIILIVVIYPNSYEDEGGIILHNEKGLKKGTSKYNNKKRDFIKRIIASEVDNYETMLTGKYSDTEEAIKSKRQEWSDGLTAKEKTYNNNKIDSDKEKTKVNITKKEIFKIMEQIKKFNKEITKLDEDINASNKAHQDSMKKLKKRIDKLSYIAIIYGKGFFDGDVTKDAFIAKIEPIMLKKVVDEYASSRVDVYKQVVINKEGESDISETIVKDTSGMTQKYEKIATNDGYANNKQTMGAIYVFHVSNNSGNPLSDTSDQNTDNKNDITVIENSLTIINDDTFLTISTAKNGIFSNINKKHKEVKTIVKEKLKEARKNNRITAKAIKVIVEDMKNTINENRINIRDNKVEKALEENKKLKIAKTKLPPLFEALSTNCKSYEKTAESSNTALRELQKYITSSNNFSSIAEFDEMPIDPKQSLTKLIEELTDKMIKSAFKDTKRIYMNSKLSITNGTVKQTSNLRIKKNKTPKIITIKYLFKTQRKVNGLNKFGLGLLFEMKGDLKGSEIEEDKYKNCFYDEFINVTGKEVKFSKNEQVTKNKWKKITLSGIKFSITKDTIIFNSNGFSTDGKKFKRIGNSVKILFKKAPLKTTKYGKISKHPLFKGIRLNLKKNKKYIQIITKGNKVQALTAVDNKYGKKIWKITIKVEK